MQPYCFIVCISPKAYNLVQDGPLRHRMRLDMSFDVYESDSESESLDTSALIEHLTKKVC